MTRVSESFRRQCRGIQVGIWTLPEIYAAGRAALAEGRDLDIAIREATEIAARGLR